MKQIYFVLTVVASVFLCQKAGATIYLTEQFGNYATGRLGDPGAGNTGGTPGWYTPQNSTTVTNGDGSLDGTSLGLIASAGDKVWIAATNINNNAAYNKFVPSGTFPTTNAADVYTSFLYKFLVGTDVSTDGQIISAMNRQNSGFTSTATFSWYLIAKRVGSNIQIGITRNGGTTTNYSAANIVAGQTFFVVVRQQIIPDSSVPDVIDLWINPPANTFGTNEANVPTPDATTSDGTDDTSNTGLGRFWIVSSGAAANIDEVRIADNWGEATPYFGQCLPPNFTVNPSSQTNVAEISATFNAFSTGTSPDYQWQISKDGGTSWTNIDGAFFTSYTTPNLAIASDNGNKYRVVANVSCDGLSVTSSVATITLTNPVVTPLGLIMDDTFDRIDRSVGPVTTNVSVWYTAGQYTDNLTTYNQNDSMLGIPVSATSSLWLGYFTETNQLPVHLGIGSAIKVTLPFIPNSYASHTNNGALRFGLFDYYDSNGSRITADGANVTGSTGNGKNVRGYMLSLDFGPTFTANSPLSLLVRNGLGDNNLMGTTGDYLSMGSGPSGGGYSNAPALLAGTQYTLEFTVTRTDINTINLAVSITGGGTNWMFSSYETNYAYHRFDSFGIRPNSLETSADSFTFKEFKVQVLAAAALPPDHIQISSITRTGNNVALSWNPSPAGTYSYTVQRKTSLTNVWTTLQSSISTTNYTDTTATGNTGFYRVSSP